MNKKGVVPVAIISVLIIGIALLLAVEPMQEEETLSFFQIINPIKEVQGDYQGIPLSGQIYTTTGRGSRSGTGSASYRAGGELDINSACSHTLNARSNSWITVNLEEDLNQYESVDLRFTGDFMIKKQHSHDRTGGHVAQLRIVNSQGEVLKNIYKKDINRKYPLFESYGTGTKSFDVTEELTIQGTNYSKPAYLQFYLTSDCPSSKPQAGSVALYLKELNYNEFCTVDNRGACDESQCQDLGLYWRDNSCKKSECTQDNHCSESQQCVNNVCEDVKQVKESGQVSIQPIEDSEDLEQSREDEEDKQITFTSLFKDLISLFVGLFN